MKKVIKLTPIFIGIAIFALLVLLFSKQLTGVFIKASDTKPNDVNITEITEASAKIIWTTGQETQAVIEYGISPTELNYFAPEISKATSHAVDLTLLAPNTTYYFQIKSDGSKYDNSGVPWTFNTKATNDTVQVNPNGSSLKPTPISSIEINTDSSNAVCDETDCQRIKAKLGNGCTTADYLRCIKK